MRIKESRPPTSEEWDHIWRNCDYSTYFHSREWAEIWREYTRGKFCPDAKLIIFSDHKQALLPFSSIKIFKGLIKTSISSPARTFGGWLSINDLSEGHAELLYEYIKAHYKNLKWRLNPYNSLEMGLDIKKAEKDTTQALNLKDGFENIRKGFSRGCSYGVNKARRSGVKVREAVTLHDWENYYKCYEDSLARWGKPSSAGYEWRLFHNIFRRSSNHIKLWLATLNEEVISGLVCVYSKKNVILWHGSSLSAYFKLKQVNYLHYEVIKISCENGYAWFDFNPSGGFEGVKNFKNSFGATTLQSPVYNSKSKLRKWLEFLK